MIRHALALLLIVSPAAAQPAWEQSVQVPDRVIYKRAGPEQVKQAALRLEKVLAKDYTGPEKIFPEMVMVGPFLWDQMKTEPAFAKVPAKANGKSFPIDWTFEVGQRKFKLPGRGFRVQDDAGLLGSVEATLRSWLGQEGPFTVRVLTAQELDDLWTLWPYDSVDEPILVVASPKHKFVVQMVNNQGMFVDDFADLAHNHLLHSR